MAVKLRQLSPQSKPLSTVGASPTAASSLQSLPAVASPSTQNVILAGKVFFYHEKAPFAKAGKSINGGLEYDQDTDTIRCHVCGEFHAYLPNHVRAVHGLDAQEYKERFGLKRTTALCSEGVRSRMVVASLGRIKQGELRNPVVIQRGPRTNYSKARRGRRVEDFNIQNTCALQLLEKIRALAEKVGRTPSQTDLVDNGLSLSHVYQRYGSMPNAMRLAGLKPREQGPVPSFDDEKLLLELLKNASRVLGRNPSASDCRRGYLPPYSTFKLIFGSWNSALIAAGLEAKKSNNPKFRTDGEFYCPRGHERAVVGTYVYPGSGKKTCRACLRENAAKQRSAANISASTKFSSPKSNLSKGEPS